MVRIWSWMQRGREREKNCRADHGALCPLVICRGRRELPLRPMRDQPPVMGGLTTAQDEEQQDQGGNQDDDDEDDEDDDDEDEDDDDDDDDGGECSWRFVF